jgi:hypothetical protein
MKRQKYIGWIKDGKYPDSSLGVSFETTTSKDKIYKHAAHLSLLMGGMSNCQRPFTLTITTFGRDKAKLEIVDKFVLPTRGNS